MSLLPVETSIVSPDGTEYRVRLAPAGVGRYNALGGSASLINVAVGWTRHLSRRPGRWTVEVLPTDRFGVTYPAFLKEEFSGRDLAAERLQEVVDGIRVGTLQWDRWHVERNPPPVVE